MFRAFERGACYTRSQLNWGFVPVQNIIGKPLIIYWSYDASTEALSKPMISLDHLLDLVEHFPSKTRWRRTFRLIHGHPIT